MGAMFGCAEPAADTAFTVRKIDSTDVGRTGAVRVKLSTPGEVAEADEGSIVQYMQVVAKREATKHQREIAVARARSAVRKMAARKAPRKTRYLVVETAKSDPVPRAKVKAAKSVMVWDTEAQSIVGNDVYDIERAPSVGAIVQFETYSAQYVGAGL